MTHVDNLTFSLPVPHLLRARAAAGHFDPHLHDTYSVVVLKRGAATISSQSWSCDVRAGDVFFFNPFEVHYGKSEHRLVEYEVLYPSVEFLGNCVRSDRSGAAPTIRTGVMAPCRQSMELVEALSDPMINIASIEAALKGVLSSCDFESACHAPERRSVVRTACSMINEDAARAISTEALARKVGVHRSHLIRVFTATIGIAPQTYIRQLRVSMARNLICSGVGISTVAHMLDFCDQAHLTREFKKVFGVPPGRLSREIRVNRPTDEAVIRP